VQLITTQTVYFPIQANPILEQEQNSTFPCPNTSSVFYQLNFFSGYLKEMPTLQHRKQHVR
jgi:hypothetical protein